jgi:hypothetical protein
LFILIDHISFRRCCHYLSDQSHQRNDIGPRSTFDIKTKANFERIASMHPYSIYLPREVDFGSSTNSVIWSRITSLRHLRLGYDCDPLPILATQTGLISLDIRKFCTVIRDCTNLLDLTTPLPTLSAYRYIPTSLTKLELLLYKTKWSFDDDTVNGMNNHFPHLVTLGLIIEEDTPFIKAGALSSLSRWSSLTKLIIGTDEDDIESPS